MARRLALHGSTPKASGSLYFASVTWTRRIRACGRPKCTRRATKYGQGTSLSVWMASSEPTCGAALRRGSTSEYVFRPEERLLGGVRPQQHYGSPRRSRGHRDRDHCHSPRQERHRSLLNHFTRSTNTCGLQFRRAVSLRPDCPCQAGIPHPCRASRRAFTQADFRRVTNWRYRSADHGSLTMAYSLQMLRALMDDHPDRAAPFAAPCGSIGGQHRI